MKNLDNVLLVTKENESTINTAIDEYTLSLMEGGVL